MDSTRSLDPQSVRQMRLVFVREMAAQVPRVRAHLDMLRDDPKHSEALDETRRFFHRIAGTAATLGLDELGRVARICERVATVAQLGDRMVAPHIHPILDDGHVVVTRMLQAAAAPE
jgi:chemotaxis protein histidine kinase CheA